MPGSQWLAGQEDKAALRQAPAIKGVSRGHRKAGVVTHVFTHFPLELVVYTASVPPRTRASEGMRWVPVATLADEAFPNVMRKTIAHALGWPWGVHISKCDLRFLSARGVTHDRNRQ